MDYVLEVIDKSKRKIYLSKERWNHISKEHPNINLQNIEESLIHPFKIISNGQREVEDYYLYLKHRKTKSKYLKLIVKYLNGKGFVITAYFVRQMN